MVARMYILQMGYVDLGLNNQYTIVQIQLAVMKRCAVTFRGLTVLRSFMTYGILAVSTRQESRTT